MEMELSYLASLIARRRSIRLYTITLSLLGLIIGLVTMKAPEESKYVGRGSVRSKTRGVTVTVSQKENYMAGAFCFLGSFAILAGGLFYNRRLSREIELEQEFTRERSD
jgi:hypothetical protein